MSELSVSIQAVQFHPTLLLSTKFPFCPSKILLKVRYLKEKEKENGSPNAETKCATYTQLHEYE